MSSLIKIEIIDNKEYQVYNGVYYYRDTDPEVIFVLDQARRTRISIRLHYGYRDAVHAHSMNSKHSEEQITDLIGKDWLDKIQVGMVSKAIQIDSKRPKIAIGTNRTLILERCVIKIVNRKTQQPLYQHPNYHIGQVTFLDNGGSCDVLQDKILIARFPNQFKAEAWLKEATA